MNRWVYWLGSAVVLVVVLLVFGSRVETQDPPPRFPQGISGLAEGQTGPPSNNWLLDARDDQERFRRIQIYASGFAPGMLQIGDRFQQVHQAIVDENWALAQYQWEEIESLFNITLMRRPARTEIAEELFLGSTWVALNEAFSTGDAAGIREAFLAARSSCMACHIREDYGFVNEGPVFRNTELFPDN